MVRAEFAPNSALCVNSVIEGEELMLSGKVTCQRVLVSLPIFVCGFIACGQPDAPDLDVPSDGVASVGQSLLTSAKASLPDPNAACTNPDESAWTNTGATKCVVGGSCRRVDCEWVGDCSPKQRPGESACPPPYCEPVDPLPCRKVCRTSAVPHQESEQKSWRKCWDVDGNYWNEPVVQWVTSGCC